MSLSSSKVAPRRKQLPPARPETAESRDFASWLRNRKVCFLHVPNEGMRTRAMAARARAEGLSKGAPDFLIFDPPPCFPQAPGVAIEMKRTRGGVTSPQQRKWLADLKARGWCTFVAPGAEAAVRWMVDVLGYEEGEPW